MRFRPLSRDLTCSRFDYENPANVVVKLGRFSRTVNEELGISVKLSADRVKSLKQSKDLCGGCAFAFVFVWGLGEHLLFLNRIFWKYFIFSFEDHIGI